MTVKVQLNGEKVRIETPAKPPVVFLDGVKKRLVKGITFIGGEKKVLWGTSGLNISLIPTINLSLGISGRIVYISENLAIVNCNKNYATSSTGGTTIRGSNRNSVVSVNIANLSSPVISSERLYGEVRGSEVDGEDVILYGNYYATGSSTKSVYNKMLVDALGNVSVPSAYTAGTPEGTSAALFSSGNWVGLNNISERHGTPQIGYFYTYSVQLYVQKTVVKTLSTSSGGLEVFAKNGDVLYWSKGRQIYKATETDVVKIFDAGSYTGYAESIMYDEGKILLAGSGGYGIYQESGTVIKEVSGDTNRTYTLLGKIGDRYYMIALPTSAGGAGNQELLILNADTGEVFETVDIKEYGIENAECVAWDATEIGYLGAMTNVGILRIRGY